jgi:hypothetical protein
MNEIYIPSPDVVAREIEGEIIIVPVASGTGDLEDELYTLTDTSKDIWEHLDGNHSLAEVAAQLSEDFQVPIEEIEEDVAGLLWELLQRKLVRQVRRVA